MMERIHLIEANLWIFFKVDQKMLECNISCILFSSHSTHVHLVRTTLRATDNNVDFPLLHTAHETSILIEIESYISESFEFSLEKFLLKATQTYKLIESISQTKKISPRYARHTRFFSRVCFLFWCKFQFNSSKLLKFSNYITQSNK